MIVLLDRATRKLTAEEEEGYIRENIDVQGDSKGTGDNIIFLLLFLLS
jgi:hypothetical protein